VTQSLSKGDFERVSKAQSRKIRPSTGFVESLRPELRPRGSAERLRMNFASIEKCEVMNNYLTEKEVQDGIQGTFSLPRS
jgi:hypothetical protein